MHLLERDTALGDLDVALEYALQAQGRVALVSGEAGIGKTSLVEHFARSRAGKSNRLLWGACDPLSTPRPLGPLHDVALQSDSSTLADVLNASPGRSALFGSVLAELQRTPTVMVIDDVHWADDATLDVLRYIGRRIARTSSLLVLTYRDDEIGPGHPLRLFLGDIASSSTTLRIELPPLSERAVAALVGDRAIEPAALHRQTGGNPFFVTEILASAAVGLPPSIRDAVLGRIERLSVAAKSVVEAAAVAGPRAEIWLLRAMLPEAFESLDECLAGGALREQVDGVAFRHELARQAVLDSIPPGRRVELHRLALEALERLPSGRADLLRLANHAEGANDDRAVRRYVPAAAHQASAAGAHRTAADLLAKCLQRGSTLPNADLAGLLGAHAMECYHVADMPGAIASWRQAIDLWHREGVPAKQGVNLAVLAAALASAGQREEARRANRAAIDLLVDPPFGRELALAYGTQAILHQYNHELEDAIELAERAIALAGQAADNEILVMAYDTLGMSLMFRDYERGCAYLERARDLAQEAGLDAAVARAYGDLGAVSVAVFRLDRAERYLAEGLTFTADRDLDRTRVYTLAWQSAAQLFRGRWDEAARSAAEVLARPASSSARVVALLTLGRLAARRGEPGTASQLLDQALSIAGAPHELRSTGPVRAARAEAAALLGDTVACRAEVEACYALAVDRRHQSVAGELAFWRWRLGMPDTPPGWIAEPFRLQISGAWRAAASAWRELGCPYEEARALADGDQAAQEAALGIFDRLGAQPAAAELRRRMRALGAQRVPRGPHSSTRANRYGLTNRQLEILGFLADGCTNAEIARRMSIAPKTAEHHVAAVLAKLDVVSRRAAVVFAREQNLIG